MVGGVIEKHGFDELRFDSNKFAKWGTALIVASGVGNTKFRGNTGTVNSALYQMRDATGTIFRNSTLENDFNPPSVYETFVNINGGTVHFTGSTFATLAVAIGGPSGAPATVDGVHFTSCQHVAISSPASPAKLTITRSRFDDCDAGFVGGTSRVDGDILIDRSNITVRKALALIEGVRSVRGFHVKDSKITCGVSGQTGYCDLYRRKVESDSMGGIGESYDPYDDFFKIEGSSIKCPDTLCRGLSFWNTDSASDWYAEFEGVFDNNHWYGRTLSLNVIQPALAQGVMSTTGPIPGVAVFNFPGSTTGYMGGSTLQLFTSISANSVATEEIGGAPPLQ